MDADEAVLDAPNDPQRHVSAAYALLDEEQHESALEACQAALALAPDWAEAHNVHGLALDALGRLREAAAAYHTALQLDPDNSEARNNLLGALTEMMVGDLSTLDDLANEDPAELAREHLEWAYELLDEEEDEDLELALWECDLVVSLDPDLAEAHNLRGIVLDELGQMEAAKAAFRTAVRLDSGLAEARENLESMETEGPLPTQDARAGVDVEAPPHKPAGGEPGDVDRAALAREHLERAYDHNAIGRFTEALGECDAALEATPGSTEGHNLRGIVLEALGRLPEALDAYRTAVHLEPDFGDARENLHELEAELGESDSVVTVTTFTNPLEAHSARLELAAHGIWSVVVDESLLITGIRLLARESDLEEITRLLELEPEEEDEGWQCPICDSWDVDVPLVGKKRRCRSCGYEWKS